MTSMDQAARLSDGVCLQLGDQDMCDVVAVDRSYAVFAGVLFRAFASWELNAD